MEKPSTVLANSWGKYREFEITAPKKKYRLAYWRYLVLILGVIGAVLEIVFPQFYYL